MNSIIPLLGELVPTLRREAGVGLLKKDIHFSGFQYFILIVITLILNNFI